MTLTDTCLDGSVLKRSNRSTIIWLRDSCLSYTSEMTYFMLPGDWGNRGFLWNRFQNHNVLCHAQRPLRILIDYLDLQKHSQNEVDAIAVSSSNLRLNSNVFSGFVWTFSIIALQNCIGALVKYLPLGMRSLHTLSFPWTKQSRPLPVFGCSYFTNVLWP